MVWILAQSRGGEGVVRELIEGRGGVGAVSKWCKLGEISRDLGDYRREVMYIRA